MAINIIGRSLGIVTGLPYNAIVNSAICTVFGQILDINIANRAFITPHKNTPFQLNYTPLIGK
jgi:hypothetical protein